MGQELSRRRNQQEEVNDLTPSGPDVVFDLRREAVEFSDTDRIVHRNGLHVCRATKAKPIDCYDPR